MNKFIIVLVVIILSGCASQQAETIPVNMMLLVADDAQGNLPHDHSGVKRMVNAISSELSAKGVNIYDAPSLTEFNGKHTEAILIDIARGYRQAPIDYLVILSAETLAKQNSVGTRINTRVVGKTVATGSGRFRGSYVATGRSITAPKSCNNYCINQNVGDSLQGTVGDITADILDSLSFRASSHKEKKDTEGSQTNSEYVNSGIQEFNLVFEGFNEQDIQKIDGYLPIFSGYDSMNYSIGRPEFTEVTYFSSISRNKLTRNLNRMLAEMAIKGGVKITGNTAKVTKLASQPKNSKKFDLNGWECSHPM